MSLLAAGTGQEDAVLFADRLGDVVRREDSDVTACVCVCVRTDV